MTGLPPDSLEQRVRALEAINAAQQAELAALRAGHFDAARLDALLYHAPDPIVLANSEGVMLDVNPALCALLGYARDELVGRNIGEVTPPEALAPGIEKAVEMLSGKLVRTEHQLLRRDGGRVFVEAVAVANALPWMPGVHIGLLRDITERRQAESQLRQTLARLEAHTELSQALAAQGPALDTVLETIMDRIVDLVGDGGLLALRDDETQEVEVLIFRHRRPELLVHAGKHEALLRLPKGQRFVGEVMARGAAVRVTDVWQDTSVPWSDQYREAFADAGTQSLLGVPLRARGDMIGALVLWRHDRGSPYSPDEEGFVQDLADRAALAIANARLLAAAQKELQARQAVEQQREALLQQLRAGQQRLHALSLHLLQVEEAQRRALARVLHDEVGQSLTALMLNLNGIQRTPEAAPVAMDLAECAHNLQTIMHQVRTLSIDLRPPVLDDLGLVAALRWYLDRQAQRAGFAGRVADQLPPERLAAEVETVCFRAAQEALTNTVRHAQARSVTVELRQAGGWLEMVISDDGVGFNVAEARGRATAGQSLGLVGLEERVGLAGGEFTLESQPGAGTRLQVRLPLERPPAGRRVRERRARNRPPEP